MQVKYINMWEYLLLDTYNFTGKLHLCWDTYYTDTYDFTSIYGWCLIFDFCILSDLAKGHVSFCHHLSSVVGRKLSHLNLLWNHWCLNQIKPSLAGMVLGWSLFKFVSSSNILHSRWWPLLKIKNSLKIPKG
jgi:hypothetical protein